MEQSPKLARLTGMLQIENEWQRQNRRMIEVSPSSKGNSQLQVLHATSFAVPATKMACALVHWLHLVHNIVCKLTVHFIRDGS